MEGPTIKIMIFLAIGLIVVFVFYQLFHRTAEQGVGNVATLIPDMSCPQGAKINDYVTRMQTFASSDSRTPEPSYAVDVFKQYLGCKNPKTGSSPFTSTDIETHDAEILSCANAAYINYLKELDTKKTASKESKEDERYYEGLITQTNKEYETFKKVFPASEYSGTMCNYPATGRSSATA